MNRCDVSVHGSPPFDLSDMILHNLIGGNPIVKLPVLKKTHPTRIFHELEAFMGKARHSRVQLYFSTAIPEHDTDSLWKPPARRVVSRVNIFWRFLPEIMVTNCTRDLLH